MTRTEVNRQNSQLSTGPRSEAGKLAVSRNAVKFGLFSREQLLASESEEQFNAFAEDLREDLGPVGALENLLADKAIWAAWRLQRLLNMERRLFEQPSELLPTNQTTEGMLVNPEELVIVFSSPDFPKETEEVEEAEEDRQPQHNLFGLLRSAGLKQSDIDLIAAEADKFGLSSEEIFARYLVNAYSPASGTRGKEPLQLLARYESTLEKSFYRALAELQRAQNMRSLRAKLSGFVL